MVEYELIIPFIIPAITALIVFSGIWHKRGSSIQISVNDIRILNEKIQTVESKLDKIIEKINILSTDTEIFRYRLKTLEKMVDDVTNPDWRRSYKQPFRPKDSNGE